MVFYFIFLRTKGFYLILIRKSQNISKALNLVFINISMVNKKAIQKLNLKTISTNILKSVMKLLQTHILVVFLIICQLFSFNNLRNLA